MHSNDINTNNCRNHAMPSPLFTNTLNREKVLSSPSSNTKCLPSTSDGATDGCYKDRNTISNESIVINSVESAIIRNACTSKKINEDIFSTSLFPSINQEMRSGENENSFNSCEFDEGIL